MRSRGLAALVVVAVLGILVAVFSLKGGGGASSPQKGTAQTAAAPGALPTEPPAPETPDLPSRGREALEKPAETGGAPAAAEKAGGAALLGRVVSADGSPVSGARVALREGAGAVPFVAMLRRARGEPLRSELEEERRAVSRADGTFEFSAAPEGKALSAAVEAEGFLEATLPSITLARGERKDVGEIRLTREGLVAGTVSDPSGRPVAGARVSIDLDPAQVMRRAPFFMDEEKTDDQGRYRLGGLPAGKVRVLASAEGWRESRSDEVEVRAGENVERVDVRLQSGRSIAGRVLANDGKPIEGAEVYAMPEERAAGARASFSIFRREANRTDASGRYEVAGLADGTYRVEVEAEGFAHASKQGVAVGSAGTDFRLDPLSGLVGRVLDGRTGKPPASFRARAMREGFPGARFMDTGSDATGREDGSFEIGGLEPGTYRVEVRADGFAPATAGPIAVVAGAPADAGSIAIQPGSALRVKVVEAGDGSPIVGAEVSVAPAEKEGPPGMPPVRLLGPAGARLVAFPGLPETQDAARKTGADGIAEVPGLAEGSYLVRVRAKDHASVRKEVFVAAANPTEVDAALAKGGTVKGLVLRANGEPYSGARVFLASAVESGVEEEASSGSDGEYRFEHVAPGDWRVGLSEEAPVRFGGGGGAIFVRSVRAGMPGEERGVLVSVAEGETATVDLREKETGAVSGRVTEVGEPVAGVRVSLSREGQPRLPFLSDLTAESGADGHFRIEAVPAGRYTLTAQKTGAAVPAEEEVQVSGGEAVVDVELPRGVIEGTIRDAQTGSGLGGVEVSVAREREPGPSGRPRAAMAVSVAFARGGPGGGGRTTVRMGDGRESVKTDAEGKYRLEGIPPGSYVVTASMDGYADGRREGIGMNRDARVPGIDLSLAKGGGIQGTVVDAVGSPVPFALVEVAPREGDSKRSVAGPDGAYEVRGLAAGVYDVSARIPGPPGPNERRATQPGVRVEPGRKATVELRLPN
ncbi:MAG TPA: carboxypeptidase-like regulatory domain-containing protein [Planctomycetota bacterium]|jgi:protocatechuate 3,4-dioxygenase beta subunit|nr:carboxypeptidase-like regulatory domain-containing protein [Planctomycetota bacterium]